MNNNNFFSETEKSDEIIVSTNGHNLQVLKDDFELLKPNLDEIELMEERCSELWSQIKDANVLNGSEFSNFSMSKLQLNAELLARRVQLFSFSFPSFSTNIQLRLDCVYHALSELQHKKANDKPFKVEGEKDESNNNFLMPSKFRKWLYIQELDLARIRQRIPFSRNSISSLQDLELEQKYLQEQIQKGHKLLCRLNFQRTPSNKSKLFDILEQRYLALWLASLESFELIAQFKKRLDTEDNEDFSSELEEGPDPKRRKTLEIKIEEKTFSYLPINTNIPLRQSNLNDLLATNTTFVMDGVRQEQQQILPLGSDIGYSSGENSVHEVIANTKSPGDYQEKDADSPLWAAHIAQSNELEKSFYRTVPLDDYGMTDLDTDDGGLGQRGNYLTREFLQDFEEKIGQGRLELTDSLIVHVDAPENRPLNEFEEVMDLFGKDKLFVNSGQPFSEDDCESLSTFAENEAVVREKRKINNRKRHTSEKRSLKTPSLFNKNEVKQNRSRKWTDTRYIRRNFTAYNAGGHLSNDFEWDDDAFIGYQTVPDDFFDKLPDIVSDKEFVESRKAFSTFYDNFRQDLAESQNLSGRLRELVTLVGKSLDDTSFLLRELHSTFESISFHCHELGEKFKENRNNSFNSSKNINSNLILLQQLINTLENTSEKLSILLKKQRLTEANSNYINNDYLNKLAKECSGIIEELKELKNKFGNHFSNSFLVNIVKNNVTKSYKDSTSNHFLVPTSLVNSPTHNQTCFLTKSSREQASSFWRSYLFMCLIGLFTSFGILLYMNSRDSVDWRWSFGPQLHYLNGRPPI